MAFTLGRVRAQSATLALVLGAVLGAGCSSSSSPAGSGGVDNDAGTTPDSGNDGAVEPDAAPGNDASPDADAATAEDAPSSDAPATDGPPDDGATEAEAGPPSGDVGKALEAFGVDLHAPMRPNQVGEPVSDDQGVIGSKASFGTIHELISVGLPVSVGSGNYTGSAALLNDKPAAQWSSGASQLLPASIDTSWATVSSGSGDTSPRWAIACDVDNDGFDETAAVYLAAGHVYLRVYEDKSGGYLALVSGQDLGASTATDLDLACGSFRGDGRGELVVAQGNREVASSTMTGKVQILDSANGYSEMWSTEINNVRSVRVAAGDINNDKKDELVVGAAVSSVAEYHLYNASAPGGAFTMTGVLTGNTTLQVNDSSVGLKTARQASVAIGDVDGTGLPSVIVAGPIANTASYVACRLQYDVTTGQYGNACKYLDTTRSGVCGGPDGNNTSNGWAGCATWVGVNITEAFVKTVNLTGSPQRQILINETVYDKDFAQTFTLPSQDGKAGCFVRNQIWWNGACWANWDGTWGRGHVALDVGDFDGNGVDEIAVAQSTQASVQLYGLKGDMTGFELKGAYATSGNVGANAPVLAAANVDDDSTVMMYDHHELVFTQPIPLAAMASPPCQEGIGQNTDWCTTSYGNSTTIGTTNESSFTQSAEVRIGGTGEVPFLTTFVGAKVEADVSAAVSQNVSLTWGSDYAVTKGIAYTSGPMEDTVVFSTIPYDMYFYKIVSAPAPQPGNPSAVGTLVPMSVPRPPVTFQAELGYYNSIVADIAPECVIGPETFSHQIGDTTTYPTVAERDATLAKYGSDLMTDSATVGQSTTGGTTTVTLDVSQSSSFATEAGFAVGATLRMTAGYVYVEVSGEVGGGFGITWTTSSSATYSGSVGTIPPATYPANQYGFGLFTYRIKDHPSKQQFPVMQYWVQ